MAWLKVARTKALNRILTLLGQHAHMREYDILKIIMNEFFVSKTTALRYVEDLTFMGRITRNNEHLKLVKAEQNERKTE